MQRPAVPGPQLWGHSTGAAAPATHIDTPFSRALHAIFTPALLDWRVDKVRYVCLARHAGHAFAIGAASFDVATPTLLAWVKSVNAPAGRCSAVPLPGPCALLRLRRGVAQRTVAADAP